MSFSRCNDPPVQQHVSQGTSCSRVLDDLSVQWRAWHAFLQSFGFDARQHCLFGQVCDDVGTQDFLPEPFLLQEFESLEGGPGVGEISGVFGLGEIL